MLQEGQPLSAKLIIGIHMFFSILPSPSLENPLWLWQLWNIPVNFNHPIRCIHLVDSELKDLIAKTYRMNIYIAVESSNIYICIYIHMYVQFPNLTDTQQLLGSEVNAHQHFVIIKTGNLLQNTGYKPVVLSAHFHSTDQDSPNT